VPEEVFEAMKGFTALSARDKGAQNLCKTTLGVTPMPVCDPTFLFSARSSLMKESDITPKIRISFSITATGFRKNGRKNY
jgi:hypothetical protein